MVFPSLFWIMFAVSIVLSCIGFYRFVWFMSVGYGLAIAGCGASLLIAALTSGSFSIPYLLACIVFMVYGCRLGLFLLIRELKSVSYRNTKVSETKPVPIFVKIVMWVACALLYPIQVSPVMYRLTNGGMTLGGDVLTWIGAIIMIAGTVIEAVADQQKSASKKIDPHMVATQGLFKYCRCPNYFGEILVWTGALVIGLNILQGWQWAVALFGYVCIFYIMVNGAQRLEKRQNKNYGSKKEYQDYVRRTPILFPFVPLYHLVKEK